MKCRVDKDKLLIDNVLKKYSGDEIDIFLLCDDNVENAQKVFNYLVELYSNINEKYDNSYINKLLIGIISYIKFCNDIKFELSDTDINILNCFDEIYCEFVENYKKELSSDVKDSLEILKQVLSKNSLSENERILLEKSFELNRQVDILRGKVDELNIQVKIYEDNINKLKSKNEKFEKTNKDLIKSLKELKKEIALLKKDFDKLKEEKEKLEQLINDNDASIKKLNDKIMELNNVNSKLNSDFASTCMELEEVTEELNKYKKIDEKKVRNKEIDNYVLSKLYEGELTLYDLYTSNCYTREEIIESLNRIMKDICVDKTGIPIMYKISSPLVETNSIFRINNVVRKYDILVTSDWHLSTELGVVSSLGYINALYNYCALKDINLIVNIGDFLDVKNCDNRFDQYSNNMRLLESIVELFPKDKNIVHAILGGNHDRRLLNLGIDPLKIMEANRSDFINLGYDNATINFAKDGMSEYIGIHHPNTYGLDLDNYAVVRQEINKYLKGVYKDSDLNKKDVYFDLFGHFHRSRIDDSNNYAYALVPALMKFNGQSANGALHLTVFFNENNKIDSIIFRNVSPDKSFDYSSEFVYTKKKN